MTITCLMLGAALTLGATERELVLETVPPLPLNRFEPAVQDQLEQAIAAITDGGEPVADAAAHGLLGQLLHVYELWMHAAVCYRNAIVLDPAAASWHHLLGDALQRIGEFEHAADSYRRALSLGKQMDPVPLLTRLGETLLELGRLDEATIVLERSLALRPTAAAAAVLGRVALARGEYARSVELLEAALAAAPSASKLHYQLALAYRGLGQFEQARRHLELRGEVGVSGGDPLIEGLERFRQGGTAHSLRGRNAFGHGDFDAAAEAFELAVAARQEDGGGWLNLGAAYAQLGQLESAEHALRRALELDPQLDEARYNLAWLLRRRGHLAEATELLDEVVDRKPHDWPARRELIETLLATGDNERAANQIRLLIEFDPEAEPRLLALVTQLIDGGSYEQAITLLEPATDSFDRAAHTLADLLSTCPDGELRDGERALELALELFHSSRSSGRAQSVAAALAEQGRCDEAAQWQAQIVAAAVASGERGAASLPDLRGWLERYRAGPPCAAPTR